MFEGLFQPMHLLVILGLLLLFFGPKRLPELGKGLGASIRDFKEAISGKDDKPKLEGPPEQQPPVQAATQAPAPPPSPDSKS